MSDRVAEAATVVERHVRSGQTLLVGGFGRGGTPFTLLYELADRPGRYRDLVLVKNDGNEPDLGIDLLLKKGMVSKLISTHVGLNPNVLKQADAGDIQLELVPQGIFAERLRAAGAGIPAFLSDIGVGTLAAEGRATMEWKGREYLVEEALPGDVALLSADRVDRAGNCWWRGTNRNMNVVMGTAGRVVLVEALEVVEVGGIPPEDVQLPGVFVDAVVPAGPRRHQEAS